MYGARNVGYMRLFTRVDELELENQKLAKENLILHTKNVTLQ
jgi:hypothetical protein